MANFTNRGENLLVDHVFRGVSFAAPTTLWVSLMTAASNTETPTYTEATGGDYARVAVTCNTTNWAATNGAGTTTNPSSGTGGQTSNNIAVTFPPPSANWGEVTHFGIHTAASGTGNDIIIAQLTLPKNINNGDPAPSFPIGSLVFTLA